MNFTENNTLPEQYYPSVLKKIWPSYVYTTVFAINIILGLPANVYTVWLMITRKGTGVVSDFFSFNLAIGEIIYYVTSAVSFCVYIFANVSYFMRFMTVIPFYCRPLFLCLICVERYMAVVYPITFLKLKPLRYRLGCSAVIWLTVAGFGVFCMFFLSTNNVYIFFCVLLPQYCIILIIKVFCCFTVLRALKNPGPGARGQQRAEVNLMKRRASIVIMVLTANMFVNYMPIFVAGLCYHSLTEDRFTALWTVCLCISLTAAFAQPFMYIHRFGNLTRFLKCSTVSVH